MSKSVFISYKSEDYESALWVKDVLETNGISCWMAPDCIPGGSSYASEIPKAIKECKVLVLIMSEKAQQSMWVPRELDQAINAQKIIMPFMLENCALKDDFNFYLSNVQRYAAYEDKAKTAQKMIAEIRSVLDIKAEEKPLAAQEAAQTVNEETVAAPQSAHMPKAKKEPAIEAGKTKEKKAGSKSKKRILLGVIAAVLAVAIGLSAVLLFGTKKRLDIEKEYRFKIASNDSVSAGVYTQTQEVLQSRLETLCKKEKFTLNTLEDGEEVIVAKAALEGVDPLEAFSRYIIPQGKMALMETDSNSFLYSIEDFDAEDIQSVESQQGKIENVVSAVQPDAEKSYSYIKLVFKDTFIQQHKQFLKEEQKSMQFCLNEGNKPIAFTTFVDKNNTLYITDEFGGGKYIDSLYKVLSEKPLEESLSAIIDMETYATWEDIDKVKGKGELECNRAEIKDDAVTFSFSVYDTEETVLSEGEITDTLSAMRDRLDVIGNPYALAKIISGKQVTGFAVKTLPTKMNDSVAKLLVGKKHFSLVNGLQKSSVDLYSVDAVVAEENALSIKFNNMDESCAFLLEKQAKNGDYLYFAADDDCLLCTDAKQSVKDGVISFTHLIYENGAKKIPIDDTNQWLVQLLACTMKETENLSQDLEYNNNMQLTYGASKKATFFYSDKEKSSEYQGKISSIADDCLCYCSDNTLYIGLDLPVNDQLAATVPEIGKKIFEAVDFEHATLDGITIYLVKEDNEQFERARIFFRKDYATVYSSDSSHEDGAVTANGIFCGGRIDLVKDKVVKNLQNDAFYQKLVSNPTSDWQTSLPQ